MKSLLKTLICVAGAAVLFASSAQAATVTATTTDPVAAILNPLADASSGTVYENVTGSVSGVRRSPWDTVAGLGNSPYTSVSKDSSATYLLGSLMNTLTFMWGSVDTYNEIKFFNGANEVDSVVGQQVLNIPAPEGSGFAVVSILTDVMFDKIQFLSYDKNAFEYANIQVSAVPLPAALPLYGAGMALMGFLGWRKRKAAANA